MKTLVETANYEEPGSWAKGSDGWPGVYGTKAYDMFVFANCCESIPYGTYVLMRQEGKYGSMDSYLRVHPVLILQLKSGFVSAGSLAADQSIARREQYGEKRSDGLREHAPKWW